MRHDRYRINMIIDGSINDEECADELEQLLSDVRSDAVRHTWTEACSQYDKGMDPKHFDIPLLVEKATADLNPERGED